MRWIGTTPLRPPWSSRRGLPGSVAVLPLERPVIPGECRHQTIEQRSRLVDVETTQMNMGGQTGGEGFLRADGEPAGQFGLAHEDQGGETIHAA